MPIVGKPTKPKPPYWAYRAKYKLRDCECGSRQSEGDIYTVYVGANYSFWVVKCRCCGRIIRGDSQEEATKNWNGGDLNPTT